MAKPSTTLFLGIAIFFYFLCICQAQKLAPALYVFGDSNVDVGNNNMLHNFARSNYAPYGVDFPGGVTGRPTNGYNFADFFAMWLGLKVPQAIRLVNTRNYNAIADGINYASSSAGILPESGTNVFPGILSLEAQVGLFKKTVQQDLPAHFPSPKSLSYHLSKSIFLVVMGANDYGFTFMNKINSTNPMAYKASADLLLVKLGDRLQDLYNLGARKFVVFEIAALGCQPSNVKKYKPRGSKCVDFINASVRLYNQNLPIKLQQLRSKLPGSNFIVAKFFDFTLKLVQNPTAFGLRDAVNPCCPIVIYGPCDPKKPACPDRNSHVYFDSFHITQASYKLLALNCFSGSGFCSPMSVKQLALL